MPRPCVLLGNWEKLPSLVLVFGALPVCHPLRVSGCFDSSVVGEDLARGVCEPEPQGPEVGGAVRSSRTSWSHWRAASCTSMKKLFTLPRRKDKPRCSCSPLLVGRWASIGLLAQSGYTLRDKNLKKLHRAASVRELETVKEYLQLKKHDVNIWDRELRWPEWLKGSTVGKLGPLGPLTRIMTCLGPPSACDSMFPTAERSGNHWQRVTPPTFSFFPLERLFWISEGICLNLHCLLHPLPDLQFVPVANLVPSH